MESNAIVEGFSLSEEMYGVRYSKLIADGDSSVYNKILEYRPYDNLTVEKIECRNHLIRNYCNKLREIVTTSMQVQESKKVSGVTESEHSSAAEMKSLHFKLRRRLGSSILRLRTAVTKAVQHRKAEEGSLHSKAELLRKDLINGPSHVFGEHGRCREISYFCNGTPKEGEINHVDDMRKCGIYQKVLVAVNSLADYSYHLLQDVDSNTVEHYNSAVAMFTGGKRTNLIQRNGYQTRCAAAVVSHNSRRPFYKLHKSVTKSSPGDYAKLYESRAKRKSEQELERRKKRPKAKRSLAMSYGSDKDYGPNSEKPDVDEETFKKKVKDHMQRLQKTDDEIKALQEQTVNQRTSFEWLEERRLRLTASHFGVVCNRRPDSNCGPVVTRMLYSKVECAATRYGQNHEDEAIAGVEKSTGVQVTKCGLFVDRERPWLAASPDGLVGDDGLIEVKCPSSGSHVTPDQLILEKKE